MELLADDHGVRNHRRRLIDHELVGQPAAVCIFGVAGVCFMRNAVWSKHDLLLLARVRRFGDGKNCPKERGDLDSKQHEEVQAGRDEAAAGGDTSDPAEGGIRCSQARSWKG